MTPKSVISPVERSRDDVVIQLELSPKEFQQLTTVAQSRQLVVAEVTRLALAEWLEREVRLIRARHLMRELGQGLGEGRPPHNVARDHDAHLYALN